MLARRGQLCLPSAVPALPPSFTRGGLKGGGARRFFVHRVDWLCRWRLLCLMLLLASPQEYIHKKRVFIAFFKCVWVSRSLSLPLDFQLYFRGSHSRHFHKGNKTWRPWAMQRGFGCDPRSPPPALSQAFGLLVVRPLRPTPRMSRCLLLLLPLLFTPPAILLGTSPKKRK